MRAARAGLCLSVSLTGPQSPCNRRRSDKTRSTACLRLSDAGCRLAFNCAERRRSVMAETAEGFVRLLRSSRLSAHQCFEVVVPTWASVPKYVCGRLHVEACAIPLRSS